MATKPSTTIVCTIPDWDQPFTDEELEAIEFVARSAVKRPSSINGSSEDGNFSRRRLPNSVLFSCPRNQPEECMRFPAIMFGGRVIYSQTFAEVEKSASELLKFVETKKKLTGHAAFGLDIEWRPSFRKGVSPGKAAVLQICGDSKDCYVMHIIHSGIPPNLKHLLEDPSSIKVGARIGSDCVKVFKDHNVSISDVQDLFILANKKLGGDEKNWSLSSLTERLVCKKLEKPNKIRLGNWEFKPLSKAQLEYAATDAFVSWHLYEVLKALPDAADTRGVHKKRKTERIEPNRTKKNQIQKKTTCRLTEQKNPKVFSSVSVLGFTYFG